jgi:hypothetical protein
MILIGNPQTAHHLGLADIECRDPLDDLLVVLCPGEHLASSDGRVALPAGAMGTAEEI